jgi:VanZ family protein
LRSVHWRWLLGALMLLALGLAARPLAPGQGPENWFWQADKVHHVWFFAALAWLGLRARVLRGAGWPLLLLGYGLAMEGVQALAPTREASGLDVLADALGIACGWWFARRASAGQPEEDRR